MDDNAGEGSAGDDEWWIMMTVIMVMMVTFFTLGCTYTLVLSIRTQSQLSYIIPLQVYHPNTRMTSSVLIMSTSLHTHVLSYENTSHMYI